ncbi:MAG: trigger factor, partial [Nitrospira sp.]|nr:trigger factor [Nitrospira sp.]
RYGREVEEDIIKKLVPDYYLKAVKESGLTPVSMPEIEILDMNRDKPLVFSATVEVKPKVENIKFDGIELHKADATVTEEDVDARIQEVLEMNAQLEVADENHALVNGDYVQIDYIGYKEGKPVPGADKEGILLEVGSGQLGKEIDNGVLGAHKGEERDVNIPDQNILLKVKIQEVKTKVLPELNDEFAKDIGGFNSISALRDSVREKLTDEKEDTIKANYKKEIVKKLMEWHPIEAPPAMVEREMDRFLARTKRFLNKKGDFTPEEEKAYRDKYTPFAIEEIKGDILLMAIGEENGINATEEEIDNEINKMAKKSGQDPQTIKKSITSMENGFDGLKIKITVEKVIGLILEKAIWS